MPKKPKNQYNKIARLHIRTAKAISKKMAQEKDKVLLNMFENKFYSK
jgi:hypothetical protein